MSLASVFCSQTAQSSNMFHIMRLSNSALNKAPALAEDYTVLDRTRSYEILQRSAFKEGLITDDQLDGQKHRSLIEKLAAAIQGKLQPAYLSPGQKTFMAMEGKYGVGLMDLKPYKDGRTPKGVEVNSLYVMSDYQGRGYGKKLLKLAERYARMRQHPYLLLRTPKNTLSKPNLQLRSDGSSPFRLQDYYERQGFRPHPESAPLPEALEVRYRNPDSPFVSLSKPLKPMAFCRRSTVYPRVIFKNKTLRKP